MMKKLENTNLWTKLSEATDTTGDHGDKVNYFNCELCNFIVNYKVTLQKHIKKEHSKFPQLDGLEDSSMKEVDPSPVTCK